MAIKVDSTIFYLQNYSYSHTYGMKKGSSSSHKDPLVSSTLKFDLVVILWTAPNYKWVSCSKFVFRNLDCTIMCVIEFPCENFQTLLPV